MGSRLHQFVAQEAWLLAGVVTLPLTTLAALAGGEAFAGAIAVVGWFLVCPILLFWGNEIADALLDGEEANEAESQPSVDPVEELKARYARGEIDDDEFERRLSVLLEMDEVSLGEDRADSALEAARE